MSVRITDLGDGSMVDIVWPNSYTPINPNPTIDPNGGYIPQAYDLVYNNIFGSNGAISYRDSLNTLDLSNANITGTGHDWYYADGDPQPVILNTWIMNDGSRWYDLSGDGHPETHIAQVGGGLYYDGDLNGSFETLF